MKNYKGSVIIIKNGVIFENSPFFTGEEAESIFLELCRSYLSNFDEYTKEDINIILDNGYERFGRGFIAIQWF